MANHRMYARPSAGWSGVRGAVCESPLRGQSICQQHLIHGSFGLGLLLLTVSPLSLRLRLGLVGTPRFHVLLGLGLAPLLVGPGVASLDRALRSILQRLLLLLLLVCCAGQLGSVGVDV